MVLEPPGESRGRGLASSKNYGQYQEKTEREIPVVLLTPATA
jgi:hypothetical protein